MTSLPLDYRRALRDTPIRYSQFGEDALLTRLFPGGTGRVIVDVGANDGITGSNSLLLEQQGWRCILVEPNPELANTVRATRNATVFECALSDAEGMATLNIVEGGPGAHGLSSLDLDKENLDRIAAGGFTTRAVSVRLTRLDTLLEEANAPQGIDVLSIDVEGHEMSVLAGFNIARWKPRLVIVEDNSNHADTRMPIHMRGAGYRRVFRSGVNDWYARIGDLEFDVPINRAFVGIRLAIAPFYRILKAPARRFLNSIRPWLAEHPALKRKIQQVKLWLGITRTF